MDNNSVSRQMRAGPQTLTLGGWRDGVEVGGALTMLICMWHLICGAD